jgi:hypothetical protein
VHISVSDSRGLKRTLALPRALLDTTLGTLSRAHYGFTRRGMAVAGCVLLAVLVFLHVKTSDPAAQRLSQVLAQLADANLIDARWEAIVVQARSGAIAPANTLQLTDAARIQRALDAAAAAATTPGLRTTVADLQTTYAEKAELIARLERASTDARAALAAAVRADAAVTMLVRDAWQMFPQRERLIAAENLAVRVIAQAQQYHHAPNASNRAHLEAYAADLPQAHALPAPVQAGLARLETDVHQLLLLKPLEQTLSDRLGALDTVQRVRELAERYQRELAIALARAERYRIALILYGALFAALLAYFGIRAIARYRDLEALYEDGRRGPATLQQKGEEEEARAKPFPSPSFDAAAEEPGVVSEHRA